MTKYKSCKWIEHGLVFDYCNLIRVCNNSNAKSGGRPVLYGDYMGQKFDITQLFEIKKQHRKRFKDGNVLDECKECVLLEEQDWDDEDYIDNILLTPWYECNSRCIYCNAPTDKYVKKHTKSYNIIPAIKDLIENNALKKNGIIDFAGGEPTVYRGFEKLLRLFIDNEFERIDIHTNAIKYSKAIENGLRAGCVNILVSVDSGTKQTHKKVKKVSSYDKVWKNLEKYVKATDGDKQSLVRTKYIIVPGVNDSFDEIKLWLDKSKSCGITCVVLNVDFNWLGENINNIPDLIFNLIDYTLEEAKKMEMHCDLYSQAREIKEQKK